MQMRVLALLGCLAAWNLTSDLCWAQSIVNGSFTDGTTMPQGWEGMADSGNLKAVRDTKVFASAPASLRLDAVGGQAIGKGMQSVRLQGGRSYRFKGQLKTNKIANGGLALVMFGPAGKQTGWNEVVMVTGTQEWCAFDSVTFLPPTTEMVVVMVYADILAGGSIWADDLSVEPVADSGEISLLNLRGSALRSPHDSWVGKYTTSNEGMTLQATGKGGVASGLWFDLSKRATYTPVCEIKTLPGNAATELSLVLTEQGGGERTFQYKIPPASGNFVGVLPAGNATLAKPSSGKSGAPGIVNSIKLLGNGNERQKLAVVVRRVELVPPGGRLSPVTDTVTVVDTEAPVVRPIEELSAPTAAAAPAVGKIVQSASGSPPVLRSYSVEAPDLLALEVEAQNVQVEGATRYTAEADDTQEDIEEMPGFRTVSRGGKDIGILDVAAGTLYQADQIEGISLTPDQVSSAGFGLLSNDDRNYASAVSLRVAGIKARPSGFAIPSMAPAMRYSIYLALPKPLVVDRNYELSAPALQIKTVKLRYNPARQSVQSLHVSQAGFRPDDPGKIGRMSLWLGSGGGLPAKPGTFQVLDDLSGKSVLDGRIESFYPADRPDSLTPGRSLSQADVFILDLSSLKTPGKYRLFVPEIGNSQPFEIRPNVWENAFTTVMRAFFAQRSGIDIGSPYAQFTRRRNYHILDNTRVRVAGFSLLQTNLAPGGGGDYRVLAAKDKPGAVISDAMGGYLENGASMVRRIDHLDASRLQLELMILFPQYFTKLPLSIPEAGRKEADLVDEALWNLDFYSKLQLADGGVCGAVIDPAARVRYPAALAFGNELLALAPDVYSSYVYAATAARAAVVLRANAPIAQRLAQSAAKAFDWAERQPRESFPNRALAGAVRDRRNLAAAELLRLSGDARYRDVFRQSTCLASSTSAFKAGDDGFDQREAVFIYVRLPDASVDAQLKQAALAAIKNDADQAVAMAQGNAWGLCGDGEAGSSTFYSTQAVQSLLHGHYLLKNEAYLKHAITHASFVLGGNPANTSFVTTLGWQSVRNPVHPYTRLTRQRLPAGLVVNGVVDPRQPDMRGDATVKEAVAPLLVPSLDQWPSAECLLDVYIAKPACDYSVHETLGPTAYLLGYLAGR